MVQRLIHTSASMGNIFYPLHSNLFDLLLSAETDTWMYLLFDSCSPGLDSHYTLTLFREKWLPVERPHHWRPEVQGEEVAEVAVTAVWLLMVQLRLDADGTLPTSHAPLQCLHPFIFTLEESKFARGILNALPFLHTDKHTQVAISKTSVVYWLIG